MRLTEKTNTPAPAVVPRLEDVDPTYAAARDLVTTLKASAAKLAAEETDAIHRLTHRPAGLELTSRVAKLLGDEGPEDVAAPDGLRKRLGEIAAERADYRRAIEEAERRESAARYAASSAICEKVRPAYADAVRRTAEALVAAHAAHRDLLKLIDDLTAAGVAWSGTLPPMQADRVLGSRCGSWLKEAAEAGFIDRGIIPKELAQ